MKQPTLRTPLARAINHGSAKEGTGHFIYQRITAIALIPLSVWFVYSLIGLAVAGDQGSVIMWFSSGFHAVVVIALLIAMFWHAKLGVQVIIEDYLHCNCAKIAALLANAFFMYGAAIISILAVLKLHLHV